MTDLPRVEPIEAFLRDEKPPEDAVLVIRAGPMTVDKLVEHARREADRRTYRGQPLASVSVAATIPDWTLDRILRERLWSRTTFATATVGTVRRAGFELLPTHRPPHYDIVLPAATIEAASTLLALFGVERPNPFRRRTR